MEYFASKFFASNILAGFGADQESLTSLFHGFYTARSVIFLIQIAARRAEVRIPLCRKRTRQGQGSPLLSSDHSFKLLSHRNLKVHQLGAFGIVDAAHEDSRARQRRVDVFHVKKEEPRLRGVRLDSLGGELRGFNLVSFFLADSTLHFLLRNRKRTR